MTPDNIPNYHFLLTILLIILNGCAISSSDDKQKLFQDLARKTIKSGIGHISERYIDPISVSDIAIEGLRGLDSIDENLKIEVTPSSIIINLSKNLIGEFIKPNSQSVKQWSETMVKVLNFARSHSSPIGSANQEKIFTSIFDGSVSRLDIFSRYAGSMEASQNRAKRSGFGGIGIISKSQLNGALILTVIESSPAFYSGIMAGDIITHVDNIPIKGWNKTTLENTIRGEIGTIIKITLMRKENRVLQHSVKRARIILPTVKLKYSNKILYVNISDFNDNTARQIASLVRKEIKKKNNSIHGMILDLRGNHGGLLSQAIKVVDLFLEKGKVLSTVGRHPSSRQEYLATENDLLVGKPIIVLINGGSASSSEIVAAALQDNKRAIIVGTSSFGKGSVQSVNRLPNDGELILTWSRFVTPSGYLLHNLGVLPNICTYQKEINAKNVIYKTLRKSGSFIRSLQKWRKVDYSDLHQRLELRKFCRPSQKEKNIDILIAERLISDTSLYSQIRDISPPYSANN